MAQRIVVVGSTNVDFVMRLDRLPETGETVAGGTFLQAFGGKGANTAMAAARAATSQKTTLITALGGDIFSPNLLESFLHAKIDVSHIKVRDGMSTGCAVIQVDAQGRNTIAVAPGANLALSPEDIDREAGILRTAALVVMQAELRPDTIMRVFDLCLEAGVPVLFNYAPATPAGTKPPIPISAKMTGLIVNETEAAQLAGMKVDDVPSARAVAGALTAMGPKFAIVTLGDAGAYILGAGIDAHFPAFPVKPVDTVAAGDTFCGALAVALVEDKPFPQAIRFASAAAAISVTRLGAQPSIPTRKEIDEFLKKNP